MLVLVLLLALSLILRLFLGILRLWIALFRLILSALSVLHVLRALHLRIIPTAVAVISMAMPTSSAALTALTTLRVGLCAYVLLFVSVLIFVHTIISI